MRASGEEHASSLLGARPPLRARPRQRVRLQIWFPSSSNRQQGWGRLSRILIVLLHVAKLHECGGRREQPEVMWEMREKPQEQDSLGFIGLLGRRQSPETQKGGWQGWERASEAEDWGTAGKILTRFRVIPMFASPRTWSVDV